MPLESATYINQLNSGYPLGGDARNTVDDHLRLIKSTLQATFSSITGAVNATQAELNSLASSGATLAKMRALMALTSVSQGALVPVGGIIMWSGSIASLSALAPYWYLCNGTNGTPNLVDKFIVGAGVDNAGVSNTAITGANTKTGGSKDAIAVSHTHTASSTSTVTDPGHSHQQRYSDGVYGGGVSNNLLGSTNSGTLTATATTGITVGTTTIVNSAGSSGTNANLVPYYALAFIMRAN